MADQQHPAPPKAPRDQDQTVKFWSPFQHRIFAMLWIATVISNVGGWMYNAASGWLMTTLDGSPMMVALVQAANSLPLFLLALPAGAIADIVDKRRFILTLEILTAIVSAIFAAFVSAKLATPVTLLLFLSAIAVLSAVEAPAWQAIVPLLVPKRDLPAAVAANSVGANVSRAIGPALAGAVIVSAGIAAPFWLDAVSNFGVIWIIFLWRYQKKPARTLPAERFTDAVQTGLRYARNNPYLRATLARAVGFFLFASAYWALLPLVVHDQIHGSAELYGVLLGVIGLGAVGGAFGLPYLTTKIGIDWLVAGSEIITAISLVLFAFAREPIMAISAGLLAGISWIAAVASLNVSAQVALPDWVRGRGLAMYVTVFFGAMTVGSVLWGEVAGVLGLSKAHLIAACGAFLAAPLTRHWKLQSGTGIDLTPSAHWPVPVVTHAVKDNDGPVMVTIEYAVDPKNREGFLEAMRELGRERKRDGAYAWGIFEDTSKERRYLETFLVDSWLEHLRQHSRVTNADRILQERIRGLVDVEPVTSHLISAQAAPSSDNY